MALSRKLGYKHTQADIRKFSWESGLQFLESTLWLKPPTTGSKMPIFVKNSVKNHGMPQILEYNFLLKRKLYIGVYIKVVAQILSFKISAQQALNSIATRSYGLNKKMTHFQGHSLKGSHLD
jgi:hypothetical protein